MAVVFELTMPGKGSWNGKWSCEGENFTRQYDEREVPKKLWGTKNYYRWDDGWEACVSVQRMPIADARKIVRHSNGFCGYDWMIRTLIKDGYIHTEELPDYIKDAIKCQSYRQEEE